MGLLDSMKQGAMDAQLKVEIERSIKYFQDGGVDTTNLTVGKEGSVFTVAGTVEDGEQLTKLNELIASTDADVTANVELEDLTPRNIKLTVTTKGSNLNVRSGAGTENDVVGKFPNGTAVTLVKKPQADWHVVTNGEITGYCHTNYLK